eukprot:1159864-Ditylum_brightwellii.AAC.1
MQQVAQYFAPLLQQHFPGSARIPQQLISEPSTGKDTKLWSNITIRGLWQHQIDAIIDVRVTNSDSALYRNRTIKNNLEAQESRKKKNYLNVCQENCKSFAPSVVTVDGVFGQEA